MKLFVYSLFMMFISVNDCAIESVDIYIISNVTQNRFFGDRNQALAVQKDLSDRFKETDISVRKFELDVGEVPLLIEQISKNNNPAVIISSGEHGIAALHEVRTHGNIKDKIVTVWSGHHIFHALEDHLSDINIVALPKYVISEKFAEKCKKSKALLIPTPTVPIAVINEDIEKAYRDFPRNKEIPLDGNYLVVLFGGDALDTKGTTHHITNKEIANLAIYISRITAENEAKVIIANNPRTTLSQMNELFAQLQKHGVKNWIYYDFHEGVRAYHPLLYLMQQSENTRAIVTGESTSMVDEVIHVCDKPIYVLKASNMSDAHYQHMEHEAVTDSISILDATKDANKVNIEDLGYTLEIQDSSTDLITEAVQNILLGRCAT